MSRLYAYIAVLVLSVPAAWAASLPFDDRGIMLLLVDNTMAAPLANELARLEQDLIGDGWQVIRRNVPREGAGTIHQVKAIIVSEYNKNPSRVKSIFLFGHVPIPQSGWHAPDGHPRWAAPAAADAWYADIDGQGWEDVANYNGMVPGDGIFDINNFATTPKLDLEFGRVDLWNMPEFPLSETELLRRYLNKNHNYKHKVTVTARAAMAEAVATDAACETPGPTLSDFVGNNSVECAPSRPVWEEARLNGNCPPRPHCALSERIKTNSYHWAYMDAAASQVSLYTADFVQGGLAMDFLWIAGSYTWNWQKNHSQMNKIAHVVMRAALAAPNYGVAAVWGSAFASSELSRGNTLGQTIKDIAEGSGLSKCTVFGDPSLRIHPVAPVQNVSAVRGGPSSVLVTWSIPPGTNFLGCKIYRANSPAGPFVPLNNSFVKANKLADLRAPSGPATYMVRAVFEQTGPQNYQNPSQGVFASVSAEKPAGYFTGDYNLDCIVDAKDKAVYDSQFGQAVAHYHGADGSGNGVVDLADAILVTKNMGQINPSCPNRPALIGDYNRDCVVNKNDRLIYDQTYGSKVAPYSGADGSGNGVVDTVDSILISKNMGQVDPHCSAGASPPLPTDANGIPLETQLRGNDAVFNPARGETGSYKVQLEQSEYVVMAIYDRRGQEIRVTNHDLSAGENIVTWDGRDADGNIVPSGVYVVRFQKSKPERMKFVVIK